MKQLSRFCEKQKVLRNCIRQTVLTRPWSLAGGNGAGLGLSANLSVLFEGAIEPSKTGSTIFQILLCFSIRSSFSSLLRAYWIPPAESLCCLMQQGLFTKRFECNLFAFLFSESIVFNKNSYWIPVFTGMTVDATTCYSKQKHQIRKISVSNHLP